MEFPKFLLADNSEFKDEVFVLHTEYPRFLFAVENEEVLWMDDVEDNDEDDLALSEIVEQALEFFESELDKYDEEE